VTEGATGRAGTLREEVARLHEPPVLGFAIASACLAALAGGLVPVLALGTWPLRAVVLLPLALGAVARLVPEGRGVRVACFGLGGVALAYAGMRAVAGDGPTARSRSRASPSRSPFTR
jgi:hypothetical protein